MSTHTNDTFTLWAHQDKASGEITWVSLPGCHRENAMFQLLSCDRVVKLECRIVPRKSKPKRGKYPNDNFGLPAGYKPHNPDNLTREQVGEGFRLLATVEIGVHQGFSQKIEAWLHESWDGTGWCGTLSNVTYRVPINTPLDINPELKTK